MDKQALVHTLKDQHKKLRTILTEAQNHIDNGGQYEHEQLIQFQTALTEHLALENGAFYPEYLLGKKARGESTEGTEKFIQEMVDIGKVVTAFLLRYQEPNAIENNTEAYKKELSQIIKTLNIRIEMEEEDVFEVFLLMGETKKIITARM